MDAQLRRVGESTFRELIRTFTSVGESTFSPRRTTPESASHASVFTLALVASKFAVQLGRWKDAYMASFESLSTSFLSRSLHFASAFLTSLNRVARLMVQLMICIRYRMELYIRAKHVALMSDRPRQICSAYLQEHNLTEDKCVDVRRAMRKLPIPHAKPRLDHTHGQQACSRSIARRWMINFTRLCGLKPYFIQMSKSDQDSKNAGSRDYWWVKDMDLKPQHDPFDPSEHVKCIVDVDYYMDMERTLAEKPTPTLLYTTQPSVVARSDDAWSHTFTADGSLKVDIAGGGSYTHPLWDYGHDHLLVREYWLGWITRSVVGYKLDHLLVERDRPIILLTPVSRHAFPWTLLTPLITGTPLKRLNPVTRLTDKHGAPFLRMSCVGSEGMTISTGKALGYNCATISARHDATLATAQSVNSVSLTKASVMSICPDLDDMECYALLEYHKLNKPHPGPRVLTLAESANNYQYFSRAMDESARPCLSPFMPAIYPGAFVPVVGKSNEQAGVNERILKLRSTVKPTVTLYRYMEEFSMLMIPETHAHTVAPYSEEEVWLRQNRPTQRRIFNVGTSLGVGLAPRAQTHMKKEPYQDVKPPRIITCGPDNDKIEYARYIYAFTDAIIKEQKWYAFGQTPRRVADKVASLCRNAEFVELTDFSRMDGRITETMRIFERTMASRALARRYIPSFEALYSRTYNLRARTTNGVKYDTGCSRSSGAADTSAFNTMDNAFIHYIAFRRMGHSENEAYAKLGIYGGDDGLTADVESEDVDAAAKMVGQVVKADRIDRGRGGVNFLSRYFSPDVWFGDTNSCCDIRRQLAKFHLTVALPASVTPAMKLVEKCRSFYLTDRNTPVIGPLVRVVMSLSGEPVNPLDNKYGLRSWSSVVSTEEQYPNEPADWMDDFLQYQFPGLDTTSYLSKLSNINNIQDVISGLPPITSPEAKVHTQNVVVNGDRLNGKNGHSKQPRGQNPGNHKAAKSKTSLQHSQLRAKKFRSRLDATARAAAVTKP